MARIIWLRNISQSKKYKEVGANENWAKWD